MTAVKMPLINVGPQVSAADVFKGNGSGPMRTASGELGEVKNGTFVGILYG